jgi:ectoine hydroxylase-related dioxygenase (phytanoyl-CoA dioxygenase family)
MTPHFQIDAGCIISKLFSSLVQKNNTFTTIRNTYPNISFVEHKTQNTMATNGTDTVAAAQLKLKEDGWCVIPNVLSPEQTKDTLDRLWKAAEESERRGDSTTKAYLDPNASNVRVFYLLELDRIFRELIVHPTALQVVQGVIGENFLISNFTANIARPGSQSMGLHSDQSLMCPDPWVAPWNLNIIWCLHDCYFENGATLYIPGSHKWAKRSDVPEGAEKLLIPFEAKAGSVIAMDGRLWHTSGANITKDQDRALMFGSYNAPFMRGQVNWAKGLSAETQAELSDDLKTWLGVNRDGNLGVVKGVNKVFDSAFKYPTPAKV